MKLLRWVFSLAIAIGVAGISHDAAAQSPADAKRTLKAWQAFYKEPGMAEADPRYMKGLLLITGSVPEEGLKAKADTIAKEMKGVKEVKNRLTVRPAEPTPTDAELQAKIDGKIEEDEDSQKAKAKGQLNVVVKDGNVTVDGKLPDYTVASSVINDIRKTPGVKTINFDELKY